MKNLIQKVTMSTLILAASSVPLANAGGFYIGAGVYQAYAEQGDFDEDDTVPAFFAGYQFIDSNIFMLSAEVGYYDLGDYDGELAGEKYKVEASAFTLAAVGYIPIGPIFEIYAKAGVATTKIDLEIAGKSTDDDGGKAFGGLGFSVDILDTIDIYAEYLVFDTKVDSSIAGIGVRFAF